MQGLHGGDVPNNWAVTDIGNAYDVIGGGTPSTGNQAYWEGDTPWITSADIGGIREIVVSRFVTARGIRESATNLVPSRTPLVVTRVGLGKVAITDRPICFSQDIQALVQNPTLICPEYIAYFLSQELKRLKFDGRGTTISGLTKKQLKDVRFPLPPFNEQRRIVAKIEELFSELDKGVESLRTAKSTLDRYRKSLLKMAFEGRLTVDWRVRNPDKLENPADLLAQIRREREVRYEAALDEWERDVSEWKRDRKKGRRPAKPKQPVQPEECEFQKFRSIPDGWIYLRFGALAWSIRNGISVKPDEVGPLKIFRISAVRPMVFDLNDCRRITDPDGSMDRYRLKYGDLVFTRYSGSRDYVGVSAMYRGDGTHVYPDKLIRCEINSDLVNAAYLEAATNCGESRAHLEARIRTTAGQSGVSGNDIKTTPVPICSPAEQAEIVRLLDARLEAAKVFAAEIDASIGHADALRQSILNKAFAGELVPQDPNDEPASALLARIQAERSKTPVRRQTKRAVVKV